MIKYFVALFFVVLGTSLTAQSDNGKPKENIDYKIFESLQDSKNGKGTVIIYQDPRIEGMVRKHIEINENQKGIDGYRIQIYSGSHSGAKQEANESKGRFLASYPDTKVYVEYNAPFWRVRVGDFRSKNETLSLYVEVKKIFPNSYPVKDSEVRIAELK